ncbi:MAG TPA: type II CAAX endopeptidase family protein [Candidatus Krumholzibacterium sp.]|nr:type II CAAX endopeptidase family protein [Candidatus Krumholzibacterium sp.]
MIDGVDACHSSPMGRVISNELAAMKDLVRRIGRPEAVMVLSTLFLILERYHSFGGHMADRMIFYLGMPMISIPLILRGNPLDFGLRPGRWRIWGVHVAIACAICILLVLAGSRMPSVLRYYGKVKGGFGSYAASRLALIFAVEFMFRGFILFGLKKKYGDGAILIQMIPFALLHIGKPEVETVGCIVTGTYFGYLALRAGSLWPAFLIHYFVNLAMVWLATG